MRWLRLPNATAPRQWAPGDLEAVTKRTIEKMKDEGWLVVGDMKDLMSEPGRFRKGRGLKADWARTPWPTASTPGCIAARRENLMVVNGQFPVN